MTVRLVSGVAQIASCTLPMSARSVNVDARRKSSRQRGDLGETSTGRVGIVATELATNLVRHGGGGELLLQPFDHGGHVEIELLAIDRGAGMADVQRCMRDGFSTGGTPGTGLGAVRRLSSVFGVYSQMPDQGTVGVVTESPVRGSDCAQPDTRLRSRVRRHLRPRPGRG